MEIVIDANILFAALIKKSITSDLLFKHKIYAPEYILEEFRKYFDLLKKKTKRSEEEFNTLYEVIGRALILIPQEEIAPYLKYAKNISPDIKDISYLALAIKLKCGLWSQDKALKRQNVVTVYNTEEIIQLSDIDFQ